MTLSQLKTIVDRLHSNERNHDLEVCIPNNEPSMGALSTTPVSSVSAGIDWNRNKLFVWPETKMVNKR